MRFPLLLALLVALAPLSAAQGAFEPVPEPLPIGKHVLVPEEAVRSGWFGRDVALGPDYLAIGHERGKAAGVTTGLLEIYGAENGQYVRKALLTHPGGAPIDSFGRTVAADGELVVVGAPGVEAPQYNTGQAYVYQRAGPTWSLIRTLAPSGWGATEHFGREVAIDGHTVAVGSPWYSGTGIHSGRVHLVQLSGGPPLDTGAVLTAPQPAPGDAFGEAIGLSGNTVAIGAPGADDAASNAGVVHVFEPLLEFGLVPVAALSSPNAKPSSNLGSTLDLDGTILAVGAPNHDLSGSDEGIVEIYARTALGWEHSTTLTAPVPSSGDRFGTHVAVRGDTLAVSAERIQGVPGTPAVHIFRQTAPDVWTYNGLVLPDDSGPHGSLHVALSDTHIAIGSPFAFNDVSASGEVIAADLATAIGIAVPNAP